uniref:'chromo' domain containing protein n=1 Tax=Solanum tuberosum TaxID=4113 RepID=M1DP73_SOLTU
MGSAVAGQSRIKSGKNPNFVIFCITSFLRAKGRPRAILDSFPQFLALKMVNTRFNGVRHVAPVNEPAEESAARGRGRGRGRGRARGRGRGRGSNSRGSERPTLVARPIHPTMPASTGNYSGTPPQNLIQDSQGAAPSTGSRSYFDRTSYNCGEPGHMRRDCPHPRMLDPVQQQTRVVVLAGNGNGRGLSQSAQGGNQQGQIGRGNGNADRGEVQPGKEVARHDDRAQCYAFPVKTEC